PRFGGRSFDGTARQHRDQMRAIFGAAVQVAVQAFRRNRQAVEYLVREALLQNFLERRDAEYSVGPGTGDGDAYIRRALGDEHADQRIARGLVAEFDVSRLLRQRKHHFGDDLVALERGREHALKELFRLETA